MSARDNILKRIRALQQKPAEPAPAERDALLAYLRDRPQSPRPATGEDAVARFRERAAGLASTLEDVSAEHEVPRAVAGYLRGLGLPMRAACWPALGALDWSGCGMTVEARNARGDDAVGISGAFCAIAETGTLMLVSGPHTPSAVSLLPETHIAILSRMRIVRGMEEAWQLLRAEHQVMPRAVNFVSGPSRTADIEQTVSMGAHGPYRVHIVLIP